MKKFFAILIGKILVFIGKTMGRGSVFAGSTALKIDKNLMYKLKMPKTVIAVTGSSGKGSTTKLIAESYRKLGYSVVHNSSGSNLVTGILTTLLENSNLLGKIKKDVAVIEMDERYAKFVFPAIKPNYVAITNITRDQPPRQGNIDLVYNEIKKALTKDMHLILNADDPYLQKLAIEDKFKITYYGIKKNKYSYTKSNFENLNFIYCPKCNSKLIYDFYHFENIGDYHCPKCSFKHPENNYTVDKIDYENSEIVINKTQNVKLPLNMLYAVYNTLTAYSILCVCIKDEEKVSNILNKIINASNNFNCFSENNRLVYSLNNKNENSTTFNQSLLFVDRDKNPKTIVIGWKEISRRYNYNDLSWLYDINFELLQNHNIEKIICVGPEQYDIATRIKLANINTQKIVCFKDIESATDYLKTKTKQNIYAILNFDYIEPFNKCMKGENL
ncbi:MAG: DUF1727 domain-containing protein [Firmicutes bacterium]|nr:DUF1727 domain-containing protein [Bacillota bacterium]